MRKQYLLFMATFLCFLFASCASKPGREANTNTKNKNYMEGNQSEIDRNVQQLEKRREADERKIDVFDYDQNKPK
jgi:PBP1b-binding outer membrane lipoprotein LpoB